MEPFKTFDIHFPAPGLRNSALQVISPACGTRKVILPMPATCSRRSMFGSSRCSTLPT